MTIHTETIELRVEAIEEIVKHLRYGYTTMSYEEKQATANRLEEVISGPDKAVALCGLPGAGKSHSAEILSNAYDAPVVSMGDAIRREYCYQYYRAYPEDLDKDGFVATSQALGDFAADAREEDPEQIPEWVIDTVREEDSEIVIIDGVRSVTDWKVLSEHFDNIHLVEVEAPFYDRLQRLQDRGREGEEDFNAVDLVERDRNELDNLGFAKLRDSSAIDSTIQNGDEDNLRNELARLADKLPHDIEDGRPFGLSDRMEDTRRRMNNA